jgi:hypothetical protein
LDESDLRNLKYLGGFQRKMQDTRKDLVIPGSCRGLLAKTPFLFLRTEQTGAPGGAAAALVSMGAGAPGDEKLSRG